MASGVQQLGMDADMVVALGTRGPREPGATETLVRQIVPLTNQFLADGREVIWFRDNPRFMFNPAVCVSERGFDTTDCSISFPETYAETNPLDIVAGRPGVSIVDLSDYFCPEGVCSPVIGNVVVYMDPHHVTARYADTLAPVVKAQLEAQGVR